jgi:hypothetical protein
MSINEYPVRGCRGKLAFLSGPGDFSLAPGRVVDSSRMFDSDVSPYCFDLAKCRLLCVSTPDISGGTGDRLRRYRRVETHPARVALPAAT